MLNLTQKQWVENRLIENGKITRNECLKNYISRLGAIIPMLKEDGYDFDAGYIEVLTPFGKGKDYQYIVTKYPAEIKKHIGAEIIEPSHGNKIGYLQVDDCVFCNSTKVALIADVTIKDEMQINHWYVECQQCRARGSKALTQGNAIYIWNRTPHYIEQADAKGLFD